MRELYRDDYYVIHLDAPRRAVFVKRTAAPFPTLADVEGSFRQLLDVVEVSSVRGFTCVVDSRDAIGRNDDAFEETLARYRPRLFSPFRRIVMLVRTTIGKLQVERLGRTHAGPPSQVCTTDDEVDRALAER